MGVTLTASLARLLKIPTPTYDAIIRIASLVNEADYYKTGRNLKNLKLAGFSPAQLLDYVTTGKRPRLAGTARKRRAVSKQAAARTRKPSSPSRTGTKGAKGKRRR